MTRFLYFLFVCCSLACATGFEPDAESIASPDGKKYVDFYSPAPDRVQALVYFVRRFPEGGSGVSSMNARKEELHVSWSHDDTVLIQYPGGRQITMQEDSVCFFRDWVYIRYIPY